VRLLLTASLLTVAALGAAPVLADLGPRPKCDAGQHHQYLYGHHCVRDGFHLEQNPSGGGLKEVSDNAPAMPAPVTTGAPSTASPAATGFASPPATTAAPTADPAPVPATPPAARGCACTVGETGAGLGSVLAGVAALAAALRRRRPR
jgi:MYXO-CTERM domain-containing protein